MSKGWFTKEDILNDLAEATGKRIARIEDRFTVSGERPPPVHVPDEDDEEFILMFGEHASQNSKNVAPDLCGIQHMLRMVNDYYDTAPFNDNENIKKLKNSANSVITISKLNPNLPEFVPKNKQENEANVAIKDNGISNTSESLDCLPIKESNSISVDNKDLDFKDDEVKNKTKSSHINETNNNDIDVTKKIDVASLNSKDIEDMREKLKLKISGTSKAECLNNKRERNLAMASLLKLYTNIPKFPKQSEPIKLMTPDYFKTVPEDVPKAEKIVNVKEFTEENTAMPEVINYSHDEVAQSLPSISNVLTYESTPSKENCDISSNKSIEANFEKPDFSLMSKEIAESVKKVDNWLNGPVKKEVKSHPIYLGPVTFKKKGTASGTSSESPTLPSIDATQGIQLSAHTLDSFVPSSNANKLTKSYMERSQSKASHPHEDIWASLERKLKEKDEAIKQGLLSPKSKK